MFKYFQNKIDLEIYRDIDLNTKINVLFFRIIVASFFINKFYQIQRKDMKIKKITKEKAHQIYKDLEDYYIGDRYNYEQIFIDSGDYDDIDKNVLYNFVSPLLDIIDNQGLDGFEKFILNNQKNLC
jgi:hypothetical protein